MPGNPNNPHIPYNPHNPNSPNDPLDPSNPDDLPDVQGTVHAYQNGVVNTTRGSGAYPGDQQQAAMSLVDGDGNPVDPIVPVTLSPMPDQEFRH